MANLYFKEPGAEQWKPLCQSRDDLVFADDIKMDKSELDKIILSQSKEITVELKHTRLNKTLWHLLLGVESNNYRKMHHLPMRKRCTYYYG